MAQVTLTVNDEQMAQIAGILGMGAVEVTQEPAVEAGLSRNCEYANAGRGLIPLFRVQYKSKRSGETDTYGVFWHGRKDGVERYGLKLLVAGGHRMHKFNWRQSITKGFFVNADECTRV